MRILLISLALICYSLSAKACVLSKNFLGNSDATMDCPDNVRDFADRTAECLHWSGEEPYDKARAEQIAQATKKLHCDAVQSDGKKLLQEYNEKPEADVIKSVLKQYSD